MFLLIKEISIQNLSQVQGGSIRPNQIGTSMNMVNFKYILKLLNLCNT